MSDYDLIIILQTYQRTGYALQTVTAAQEWILTEKAVKFAWLVVDDGSEAAHLEAIKEKIGSDYLLGVYSRREGYGALANRAWQESVRHGPITLWLEDDWVCDPHGFNLALYTKLLNDDSAMGMVRLARIPIGLQGEVIGDGCEVYLKLAKGVGQYYFSGNPSLRHQRFYEVYGDYPTGLSPAETELAYDRKIQQIQGPEIVFPFDIGTWGAFGHIGTEKSF